MFNRVLPSSSKEMPHRRQTSRMHGTLPPRMDPLTLSCSLSVSALFPRSQPLLIWKFSTSGQPNPKFHPVKGFIIDPPNLCTVSLLNTLRCVAATNVRPKLVILTSTGVTSHSHSVLPLPMKTLYWYLLRNTLQDKRGIETLLYHGLGKEYEAGQTPGSHILPAGWEKELPAPGWLKSGVVIRAALLTDGPMTEQYRAAVGDFPCYRVSRADVGHFIAGGLLSEWPKWEGNVVCVGY
jgi:hypothetical protein